VDARDVEERAGKRKELRREGPLRETYGATASGGRGMARVFDEPTTQRQSCWAETTAA
jgi:hypothetical protein